MNLSSLIYQFIIGGAVLLAALIISWRSGDYAWNKREDRRTFIYIILGFALYLILHILWQLYALAKI